MIQHGDCLDVMATFDAESVDAIVTDPPYGLEFMGKEWDGADGFRRSLNESDAGRDSVFGRTSRTSPEYRTSPMRRRPEMDAVNTGASRQGGRQRYGDGYQRRQARDMRTFQEWCESWAAECYRVAKPGAHLLAFGGTRTYHRLASAIEDAGWEIRDTLVWAYASGFPKSRNLDGEWQGWGTALKPAWEPIVMARKPLRGTVAANVTEYGTGAINIDGCRIGTEGGGTHCTNRDGAGVCRGHRNAGRSTSGETFHGPESSGARWPANVILTDPIFDGDTPSVVGGGEAGGGFAVRGAGPLDGRTSFALAGEGQTVGYGDSGTYSRFFLIPKADRADREPVLGGQVGKRKPPGWSSGEQSPGTFQSQPTPPRENVHPTVKPTDLMRHLVRLVTPPGGTVLDPFLGSGTTALACEAEGFAWIGIEREAEYVAIAEARLNGTQRGLGLVG